MNMSLISDIIDRSGGFTNRKVKFNATTNGTLLKKHIGYLVEHDFDLLISLDGDKIHHSYRTYANGQNSFDDVLASIDFIRDKYPDYYQNHVSFNAVLHNRNSVSELYTFFKKRLGKIPAISQLNASGIQQNKADEFYRVYRNFNEDLAQTENYEQIESALFVKAPSYNSVLVFL